MVTDEIKLKVKVHDNWMEEARLWVAIIGGPAEKKSPAMGAVYKPVKPIEKELRRTYGQAMEQYEALPPDERKEAAKPVLEQISFTDTTVEACQEAMRYSPAWHVDDAR